MKKSKSQKFTCASLMPPLRHSVPGQAFDIRQSEAVHWLLRQPSIAQYVFDMAKRYLLYDADTGTWHGSDYVG